MEELDSVSSAAPRPRLPPGTTLGGRYELVRAVAAGGFGAVYEARHVHTGRRVALKVLHAWLANDDDTRERFRRELQAPAAIDHPGIVDVIDADVDSASGPFLVMEWLDGQTLRQRLRGGQFSLTELRDVFAPLLSALEAAHGAGFVHRDLKPENCIIARGPDGVERPRIVDFGLARGTGARDVTVTGTSLGTPRYMSPEQFMDSKTVGPASDVWAIGVMMYEALTGASPFEASSSHAMMLKILTEPHVPLAARLPACPSRLAALIERCLEKEPGERPSDARAVRSLFLGAYAAISGGMELRTIPEMPQGSRDAARPKDSADRVTAAARPRAAAERREPPPEPKAAPAQPPVERREPAAAVAPRPVERRESPAPRPVERREPPEADRARPASLPGPPVAWTHRPLAPPPPRRTALFLVGVVLIGLVGAALAGAAGYWLLAAADAL